MGRFEFQAGGDSLSASKDPKLGLVAVKLKMWAEDLVTAINADVPSYGLEGLVEAQPRTVTRSVAGDQGGYDVMVTLEGHQTPQSAEGVEYSLRASLAEDPIETSPRLEALLEIYQGKEDAQGKATWPKTLTEGSSAAGQSSGETGEEHHNNMHGVIKWRVPGLIWTRKRVLQFFDDSLENRLGKIDNPPGNPPQISEGRNWLKIRAEATQRGNVWQIEESWELSGRFGWVPELYE